MPVQGTSPGVYLQEIPSGSNTIQPAATSITAFLGRTLMGPSDSPLAVSSLADYERLYGSVSTQFPLSCAVRDFFLTGGAQAIVAPISNASTLPGDQDQRTGLYQLEAVDLFNILCVPSDDLMQADGGIPTTFWSSAASYCAQRRAMLLVEPPQAWTDHALKGEFDKIQPADLGIAGDLAHNAAVYFPRAYTPDPLDGRQEVLSSTCGMIAGIWAATDQARGVWKAPAGLAAALNGISRLELELNDTQNGILNPLGINALRTFPVGGSVVWGARTLSGIDAAQDMFKYIPVRRLALFIEESLYRGTKWAIFEPNEEALWSQLRLSITVFLADLFTKGACAGPVPSSGFFVHCDASTTTSADVAQGIVNIQVGFAPLKPAAFIVLEISQAAGQSAGS